MIQLRGLHAELRPYAEHAVRWANHYGINPTITSVYRTFREQIGWRVPPNDWIHSELPNWRNVVHG
jgi:hypothetical protein